MITGNSKCMNSRNSQTSPSAISKDTIGQLTPRLRVGLTRNFKSPKPLHASLKWTPQKIRKVVGKIVEIYAIDYIKFDMLTKSTTTHISRDFV